MTARVTWTATTYGAEIGQVGEQHLFTISDDSTSQKAAFTMRTDLPTGGTRFWKSGSPDRLKDRAEKVLAAFVASLGAVFPAEQSGEAL